jgi:hypothetical protein
MITSSEGVASLLQALVAPRCRPARIRADLPYWTKVMRDAGIQAE